METLLSEGGNLEGSTTFFRGLRKLCTEYKVAFIIDEVQTGVGASGKFWAIENYMGKDPALQPDLVAYAKKAQGAGVLMKPEFRPPFGNTIFGTWSGDYLRLKQLDVIIDTIKSDNLMERVTEVSGYTMKGMWELARKYPTKIMNPRGLGNLQAFDAPSEAAKAKFLQTIKEKHGINMAGAQGNVIRLRPSLIFGKKHADILLEAMDATLQGMKSK